MIAASEDGRNGRINVWVSNLAPASVPLHETEVSGFRASIRRDVS